MEIISYTILEVICEFNQDHIIQKDIEIKPGSQDKTESVFNVYCPWCDKWTNAKVKGELAQNTDLLRKFGFININEE